MQVYEKRLTEIMPYENNPRNNDGAVDAVAASIQAFGFQQPIVLDRNGIIIAGHTRYKAAQKLGLETVPCVVADELTPEEVRAYRLADNKTGELAGWDFSALEKELAAIEMDMSEFGFGEHEPNMNALDDLFAPAPEKEPEDPKQIQCPHCKMWFTP